MVVSTEARQLRNGVGNELNATLEVSEILRVNGEKKRQFIALLQR